MDKVTFYGPWSIQVVRPWSATTGEGRVLPPVIVLSGNDRPHEPTVPEHYTYDEQDFYIVGEGLTFQVSGQQWDIAIWAWPFPSPCSFKKSANFTGGSGLVINLETDGFRHSDGIILACTCLDPAINLPPLPVEPVDFTLPENVKIVESHGRPEQR